MFQKSSCLLLFSIIMWNSNSGNQLSVRLYEANCNSSKLYDELLRNQENTVILYNGWKYTNKSYGIQFTIAFACFQQKVLKHHIAPQPTKLNISMFIKEYKINCVIEINISCLSSSQNRKIFLVVYVYVFE